MDIFATFCWGHPDPTGSAWTAWGLGGATAAGRAQFGALRCLKHGAAGGGCAGSHGTSGGKPDLSMRCLAKCSTNTEKEILKHEFKFNLRGSCLDECEINQPTTEFHSGEQILGATDQKHGSKDLPTCATYGDFKGWIYGDDFPWI